MSHSARKFICSDLCALIKMYFVPTMCHTLYLRVKSENKTYGVVSACEDFTGWWGTGMRTILAQANNLATI